MLVALQAHPAETRDWVRTENPGVPAICYLTLQGSLQGPHIWDSGILAFILWACGFAGNAYSMASGSGCKAREGFQSGCIARFSVADITWHGAMFRIVGTGTEEPYQLGYGLRSINMPEGCHTKQRT